MTAKAFLFPGQGSQEIGMGQDLFRGDQFFRSLISLGSELTNEDLEKLCLKGPDKKLMQARYLQPLLVAVSLGYHRLLVENGIRADYVCGHSLGEISALSAAGVVSPQDAIRIAAKRGELMDMMASRCTGGMLAVMFVPITTVEEMLNELDAPERIVLANDNAPDQVVLSGEVDILDTFASRIFERQLGKCKRVMVSGPWHSPYIREARVQFEEWVESVIFGKPLIPIVLNATSKPEVHPTTIKHLVTWQLTSPVFWRESMTMLQDASVDTLFEVGPGRVLSGLARVNGFKKDSTVYNINNVRGIDLALQGANA